MADDKAKNQNQQRDQNIERPNEKAKGATATRGAQGQQASGEQGQDQGRNPQGTEIAGQGGGIQGSGQRQGNPGGFSDDQGEQREDREERAQDRSLRDDQGGRGQSKR